jgi:protein tyrosine phosphatase
MASEYKKLPMVDHVKEKHLFTKSYENKESNRYPDILPFDSSIVELPPIPKDHFYEGWDGVNISESSYINANHVRVDEEGSSIILSQAPMPNTVDVFWWMILKERIQLIGMLAKVFENGRCKSVTYWPKSPGQVLYVLGGKLKIVNIGTSSVDPLDKDEDKMVISKLVLEYTNPLRECEKSEVTHYHYKRWPDHGVPQNGSNELIQLIKDMHLKKESNSGIPNPTPFVIHCSAGCGRAGVICAAFRRILTKESTFEAVRKIRRDRMNAVQSDDQYEYISTIVNKYI